MVCNQQEKFLLLYLKIYIFLLMLITKTLDAIETLI